MQGTGVWSLAGELRSHTATEKPMNHMESSIAKIHKKKKLNKMYI